MGLEIFHQALLSVCSSALHVLPLVTKSPRLLPPYLHTGSDQILNRYVALCTVCEMEVAKPGGEAKIVQAVQSV